MLLFKLLPEDLLRVAPEGDDPAPGGGEDKPAGGGADPTPAPDVKDEKPAEGEETPEGDEKPEGDESDPQAETIEQLAQAKADKIVAERLAEAEAAAAAEKAAEAAAARAEETGRLITKAKADASTEIVTALKDIQIVVDGKATAISDALMDTKVFGPMNKMLASIETAYQAEAADEFVSAALDMVPEEGRPAFLKATADQSLSPTDWLKQVAESMAPATKWARQRALDVAEQVAKAKAEGFDAGKAAKTVSQPSQNDGSKRTPLTRQAFLDMTAEQQAKAYAERPDEVDALT